MNKSRRNLLKGIPVLAIAPLLGNIPIKTQHNEIEDFCDKNVDEQIRDIMENFDFEKVHRCMVSLGWEWGMPPNGKLPTLTEIKCCALELLNDTKQYSSDIYCWGTGGFTVRRIKGFIQLSFEITNW